MITLHKTVDKKEIISIVFSEGLADIIESEHPGLQAIDLVLDPNVEHLLGIQDGVIVGLFSLKHVNAIMGDIHILVKKEFWGTGVGAEMVRELVVLLKKHTRLTKIMTNIPEDCIQVRRYVQRIGFKEFGVVPNGTVFGGKLQDLHYYYLDF